MEERETISATRAMQMLGLSRSSISRMVQKGDLEGYKLNPRRRNSHLRIYLDSVEEFLESRRKSPS